MNALIPLSDMQVMAKAIADSNLFGMKTPQQVLALMLVAQSEGRHPASVARDYSIIQGRPAKNADAMLRDFIDAGGKVEWHKYDDDGAAATFSHPQGGTLRVDWDAARAKKAGLSGKDNYNKYGRQMYGARTISEGVRKVYPAATSGMYEVGEVRQIVREDKRAEKDMGAAEVVPPDTAQNPPQASASNTQQASPSPGVAPAGDQSAPKRFDWEQAGELDDVLPDPYDRALVSYSQASSVIHIKQADAIAKTISEESKLASLREHRKEALARIKAAPVAEQAI